MAKLTQIEQLRRQKSRRKTVRNLLILVLFGVVVLAVSSLSGEIGKTELKAAMSDIKAEITSGDGFPVALPVGTLKRMDEVSGALVMQTDTHLYTFNETGRQMLAFQHGMENPMIAPSRDRMLAFDRGGTKLHVMSRSAQLQSMDSPFTIFDADLNAKGTFAVASGSDSYLAQVLVYDASFNNIFNWFSAEYPVVGVSVSDQKDAMVVACVGVKSGVFSSHIKRFQFNMAEEMASVELKPGELLLAVDYHSAAGVRALTDSRVVLLNADLKEIAEYPYDDRQLSRFLFLPDGRTMLELQDPTGEKNHTLHLLSSRMETLSRFNVSGDLLSMSADAEYLYLADRNRLYIYSVDGTHLKTITESAVFAAQAVAQKLYYATATELKMIDVRKLIDPKSTSSGKKPDSSKKESSKTDDSEETSSASEAAPDQNASMPQPVEGESDESRPADTEQEQDETLQPDPGSSVDETIKKPPEDEPVQQLIKEPVDEPAEPNA